jgi:predicted DsbA family dithiol-disulfide isomerase
VRPEPGPTTGSTTALEARYWRDYLCPWCYVGRDRTELIESLGVTVTHLPYELHPEIPAEGRAHRPGGRYDRVLDAVEAECAAVGLPFTRPTRSPNTRRVLERTDLVRLHQPEVFAAVDDACWRRHWAEGGDLGDADEVRTLLASAGVDVELLDALEAEGAGAAALEASMAEARRRGVTSTPTWVIGELAIPGAQPRATIERWVGRLVGRAH